MNHITEYLKVKLWLLFYYPYYSILFCCKKRDSDTLHINSPFQTIKYILEHRCSVSRYGDGELQLVWHYAECGSAENFKVDTFQRYDEKLAKRLAEILSCRNKGKNHIVCIPEAFKSQQIYKGYTKLFWKRFFVNECVPHLNLFSPENDYYDTNFTRFYMDHTAKWNENLPQYIELLKRIWDNRDVCFIEGDTSRLGVGNDLFNNARSVTRLLVPATDAYSKYNEILSRVDSLSKHKLYLLALGATATVLAYDMANLGYWAIDVGHVDIEYEWMKIKAKHKVAISNKYVNEVKDGRICSNLADVLYQSQIIGRIR